MFTMMLSKVQASRLLDTLIRYASFLNAQANVTHSESMKAELRKASAQAMIDAQSVNLLMEGHTDVRCAECRLSLMVIATDGAIEVAPHSCV